MGAGSIATQTSTNPTDSGCGPVGTVRAIAKYVCVHVHVYVCEGLCVSVCVGV